MTAKEPEQQQEDHFDSKEAYSPLSRNKFRFVEKYGHMDQRELGLELLYTLKQHKRILEQQRKTSNRLLVAVVAIPVLAVLVLAVWGLAM